MFDVSNFTISTLSLLCLRPAPPQTFCFTPVKLLSSSSRRSPKKSPEVGEHYLNMHYMEGWMMIRVWNFSIPQHHLITILWRAKKKGSILVKKSSSTLATNSPQWPQQRGLCHLTPIAKCASCQRTPSRGSDTSSWGRTTSERRLRASSPSWLVSFKEAVPNVTC